MDTAGVPHEGRIRILPLNPAFCFPEFHPHDRTRMIRFKLKYKFWGTAQDGTRMVMTYVELMTEDTIEEYINDELIDQRPNPIGEIPIAFAPNFSVASSPWGLGDANDIISLNREYNEKATEISDIINYHVAPVTVITGAKASNLEKGPRKVWAIGNKDAKIQNLELETNFTGPLGYMELLKQSMHEFMGVPAAALGTMQPISNTSGVALSMQYQPLMLKHERKKIQYIPMFQRINELVIKHAFLFAPDLTVYNPMLSSTILKPDQLPQLDPADPSSYRSYIDWPSPDADGHPDQDQRDPGEDGDDLGEPPWRPAGTGHPVPRPEDPRDLRRGAGGHEGAGCSRPHPLPDRRLQSDGYWYDARRAADDDGRRRRQPRPGDATGRPRSRHGDAAVGLRHVPAADGRLRGR